MANKTPKDDEQRKTVLKEIKALRRQKEGYEGDAIVRRGEWVKQYLGVRDPCGLRDELKRFQTRRRRLSALPRDAADIDEAMPGSGAEAKGKRGEKLCVVPCKNPAGETTWGHTGKYITVDAAKEFASATLRFELSEKDTAHVYPGTILVARWDKQAKRFVLLPQSGYNEAAGYAYARIARPGIYTAIGLPCDPRILTTLRVLSVARSWLDINRMGRRRLIDPICQLILCANFMGEVIRDERFLGEMGLDPSDFPGGFGGGNLCDELLRAGR